MDKKYSLKTFKKNIHCQLLKRRLYTSGYHCFCESWSKNTLLLVYPWVWIASALRSLWDIGIIIRKNSYCYCPRPERGPTHLGGCPGGGRKPVVHSWGHPKGYAWGLFSCGKKSRGETKFIMPMTKKVRAVMLYKRISEKISLACFRSVELAYEIFRLCKWTQLF